MLKQLKDPEKAAADLDKLHAITDVINENVSCGIPKIKITARVLRAAVRGGFHACHGAPQKGVAAHWLRTLAEEAQRAANALEARGL